MEHAIGAKEQVGLDGVGKLSSTGPKATLQAPQKSQAGFKYRLLVHGNDERAGSLPEKKR